MNIDLCVAFVGGVYNWRTRVFDVFFSLYVAVECFSSLYTYIIHTVYESIWFITYGLHGGRKTREGKKRYDT
jgi:hypothetical protein